MKGEFSDFTIIFAIKMNNPLQNKFKIQIEALSGFEFQAFIVELFLLKYGAAGFTVLRKTKDKGCDGIIVDEKRIIACYGPEVYNQKKFDKKIQDDFEDYTKYWQSEFPRWMFIVNMETTPAQIQKSKNLNGDISLIGIKGILAIIDELDGFKKRKIAKYLNIEAEYLAKDYLKEILDDLLKNSSSVEPRKKYERATFITEKIKLNFSTKDVEEVLKMYEVVVEYFGDIQDLYFGYEDEEIDRIKGRIIWDYSQTTGTFAERFYSLTSVYSSKYSMDQDDDYKFYVRALLIYIFEQCLIGEKIAEENDTTTS